MNETIHSHSDNMEEPIETPKVRKVRKLREYQYTNTDHLTKFLSDFNLTSKELSSLLHVGSSTVSSWISKNHCPKWTLVAIEGLRRRRRADGSANDPYRMYLISVPVKHTATAVALFNALDARVQQIIDIAPTRRT